LLNQTTTKSDGHSRKFKCAALYKKESLFSALGRPIASVPCLPSLSLLVALGPESLQHALTPFLIGGTESGEILGRKSSACHLALRDPDHLPPVGLFGRVRLLPHLAGDQREAK
jgi:hypothetical protein